jgi:AraC-like DNA-binding protein
MVLLILLFIASIPLLAEPPAGDTLIKQEMLKVERLADMHTARAGHNVFYAGGELTVVGGHTSGFVLTPTAEYYSGGKWHLVTTVYPHDNGLSVVLGDGQRVLLAGGHEKNLGIGQRYEAEVYNAISHTFDGFGCMDRNRAFAQGVELDNGQVLISGNHKGNDALEMYDGQKSFNHVKEITTWRSAPYVLPVAEDDAIVFGSVWRNQQFEPCDTIDRLKGESFIAPLLKEWMPLLYCQYSHAQAAFIGNKAKGDYTYLVAAMNLDGEVAFIHIHDTVFSLLPTSCPIPTMTKWGQIKYQSTSVADTQAHRAYLVGADTTGRVYVIAVEYDQDPAPVTLYYTDPLSEFGNTTPILTSDGNLIVTGGIADDNFSPFASVWLLHTGNNKTTASITTISKHLWWWLLGGLLIVLGATAAMRFLKSKKNIPTVSENSAETMDLEPSEPSEPSEASEAPQADNSCKELMSRIIQLMEIQHPYLNPELKISDIANALGVHRNTVSSCINSQRGCTFSQFVNNYRLQHSQKLLLETRDMKISTVGMESGFANERSFFRSFKAATGQTPKEWKDQQGKNL